MEEEEGEEGDWLYSMALRGAIMEACARYSSPRTPSLSRSRVEKRSQGIIMSHVYLSKITHNFPTGMGSHCIFSSSI